MQLFKAIMIAATALVFLVGSASIPRVASAVDTGGSWDRFAKCKIDCNEAYGGLDVFPPALTGPRGQGYADCILKCDRQYWKDFDKETEMK